MEGNNNIYRMKGHKGLKIPIFLFLFNKINKDINKRQGQKVRSNERWLR